MTRRALIRRLLAALTTAPALVQPTPRHYVLAWNEATQLFERVYR